MPWGHATISRSDLPQVPGEESRHRYQLTFSQDAVAGQEVVTKFVASCIVFAMPPRGLEEAVTSLWDIFEYHREESTAALPAAPDHKFLAATVVGHGDRGPLAISE
jgi:hypothetical protein